MIPIQKLQLLLIHRLYLGCGYTYDATNGKLTDDTAVGATITIKDGKILKDGNDTGKTIKDVFGVSDGNLKNIQDSAATKDYVFENVDNGDGTHSYQIIKTSATSLLKFDTKDGKFKSIGNGTEKSVELNLNTANLNKNGNFQNITVDFSQCLNYSGKSTIGADAGSSGRYNRKRTQAWCNDRYLH